MTINVATVVVRPLKFCEFKKGDRVISGCFLLIRDEKEMLPARQERTRGSSVRGKFVHVLHLYLKSKRLFGHQARLLEAHRIRLC